MMKKIRILHVAQAAGGVDRYIRMLLKHLDKDFTCSASAEGYTLKDTFKF